MTDFGISCVVAAVTPAAVTPAAVTTADGAILGTPAYMSPEQATGEALDARSDLYALGATAYHAAAGRPPFEAPNALAMLARHAAAPAPPLLAARPDLPPEFALVVDRCLAKRPAQRWPDAEALVAAMDAVRGAVPDVPAAVRDFLADASAAGSQLSLALVASLAAFAAWSVVQVGHRIFGTFFVFFESLMLGFVGLVMPGLALLAVGRLLRSARALQRLGYGHAAVRPALAVAERLRRTDDRDRAAARRRHGRTAGLLAAGIGLTALSVWVSSQLTRHFFPLSDVVSFVADVTAIVAPTATLQRLWTTVRAGRPSLWHRLLGGGPGRALFRLARVGLRDTARPIPAAGEPTVLALGRAVAELFAKLPMADRQRLGDVPALLDRLQADALALHARRGEADAAARHASAVAALEAVRLDLLRLWAGDATLDELTRDVEAARALGEYVDAELAARNQRAAP